MSECKRTQIEKHVEAILEDVSELMCYLKDSDMGLEESLMVAQDVQKQVTKTTTWWIIQNQKRSSSFQLIPARDDAFAAVLLWNKKEEAWNEVNHLSDAQLSEFNDSEKEQILTHLDPSRSFYLRP